MAGEPNRDPRESSKRIFANIPKLGSILIHLGLGLPVAYLFCWIGGHAMPTTIVHALTDVGFFYLFVIAFIPLAILLMVVLKLYFYGSVMGTQLRVSGTTKRRVSIGFLILAVPLTSIGAAQLFLWATDRPTSLDSWPLLQNGFFYLLASVPGLGYSLIELRNKIALVERQRAQQHGEVTS